ncbi:MAG: alpha/beta hydrolase [Myxococcota bacterium]|nr:alpha/beta hydrolase [Myxococcota bacterium]
MSRLTAGGGPGPQLFHLSLRLASRALGGEWGAVPPAEDLPLPEELRVPAGAVTLACLRWPARSPAVDPPRPPLLLLHGLNNNAWSWARVAGLLGGDREIVAVSLRGHGRSSSPRTGYSLAETAEDLRLLLDALPGPGFAGPVHLAGHSWGGKVACQLAASHPERVGSLTLADPVPPWGLNPLLLQLPSLVKAAFRPERGPFPDRAALLAGRGRMVYLQRDDRLDRILWEESFRPREDGSWVHVLGDEAFREILVGALPTDLRAPLQAFSGPVLLLRPTFTLSFWPGEPERFREVFPGLREVRLPGDHTFIHTNPLATARELTRFLAGLP